MKNKIELFKIQHPSMSSLIDNSMVGLPCDMVKVAPNALNLPIQVLDLPIRALNCLKDANIITLIDLVQSDKKYLMKYRNLGVKTLHDIESRLNAYGLKFGMEITKLPNKLDTNVFTTIPKVFLMSAGDKYVNIKLGYKERIWGSNYSKGTIKSHQNINEGDIIIVYCSDKENNLQGFHMIGKVMLMNV